MPIFLLYNRIGDSMICTNCGNVMGDDATVCNNCNAKLDIEEDDNRRSSFAGILLLIVGLVIMFSVGPFFIMSIKSISELGEASFAFIPFMLGELLFILAAGYLIFRGVKEIKYSRIKDLNDSIIENINVEEKINSNIFNKIFKIFVYSLYISVLLLFCWAGITVLKDGEYFGGIFFMAFTIPFWFVIIKSFKSNR